GKAKGQVLCRTLGDEQGTAGREDSGEAVKGGERDDNSSRQQRPGVQHLSTARTSSVNLMKSAQPVKRPGSLFRVSGLDLLLSLEQAPRLLEAALRREQAGGTPALRNDPRRMMLLPVEASQLADSRAGVALGHLLDAVAQVHESLLAH